MNLPTSRPPTASTLSADTNHTNTVTRALECWQASVVSKRRVSVEATALGKQVKEHEEDLLQAMEDAGIDEIDVEDGKVIRVLKRLKEGKREPEVAACDTHRDTTGTEG